VDPDPHHFGIWIRISIKLKSMIRIRINVMRIRNKVPDLVGCSGSDGSATFFASRLWMLPSTFEGTVP
jgi:hypothetical protein